MEIDDKLDRIDAKLDDIREKATLVRVSVGKIEEILAAQHVTLVDHTTRSTNLEARIIPLEKQAVIFAGFGQIFLALVSSGLVYELFRFIRH